MFFFYFSIIVSYIYIDEIFTIVLHHFIIFIVIFSLELLSSVSKKH